MQQMGVVVMRGCLGYESLNQPSLSSGNLNPQSPFFSNLFISCLKRPLKGAFMLAPAVVAKRLVMQLQSLCSPFHHRQCAVGQKSALVSPR